MLTAEVAAIPFGCVACSAEAGKIVVYEMYGLSAVDLATSFRAVAARGCQVPEERSDEVGAVRVRDASGASGARA